MSALNDKTAVITGAASGIGAATARAFAEAGATLILTDRDAPRGQALAAELDGGARFIAQDVGMAETWPEIIGAAESAFGALHVLVNCAGYTIMNTIEDATEEQWRAMMAVHADGAFFGCRAALPAMRRAGYGSIINVSSNAAVFGYSAPLAYSAAKAAQHGLTRSIAAHCRKNGYPVRCNVVMPGGIDTPLVRATMAAAGADLNSPETIGYLQSLGRPEDVAGMITFLASPAARHVSGEMILVDGAMSYSA